MGSWPTLGGLWRWWTQQIVPAEGRVFLISDSRFVADELGLLDDPRIHLMHQMHNPHLTGARRLELAGQRVLQGVDGAHPPVRRAAQPDRAAARRHRAALRSHQQPVRRAQPGRVGTGAGPPARTPTARHRDDRPPRRPEADRPRHRGVRPRRCGRARGDARRLRRRRAARRAQSPHRRCRSTAIG